ncbi:MAG: glycosyltransferase family 4 protein [Actinomycetota bacterium]
MRVLLWHGYLLSGSGSNVYTANLARVWRDQGHDVLVMCQDRNASSLPFVDADADFPEGDAAFSWVEPGDDQRPGRCRVLRPHIGGLLPVYVYDEYEGFTVKRFVDLTDDELKRYTELNVDALTSAIESFGPAAIVTGHEVMGPCIARRATERTRTSYIAKLHGSALEYAVKVQERYRHLASEGLEGAKFVIGGSHYMVSEAASVIPGWKHNARVVNPGCDVDIFKPLPGRHNEPPVVGFVGKLMASKGVHNLLAALGLVAPAVRSVVVGYGGFEVGLRALATALRDGDRRRALEIAEEGEGEPLDGLAAFLRDAPATYFVRAAEVSVEFTGRLEHGPLSRLLPTFDLLVVPSVVPEAFGMVAAEAAACGVLPVVPAHSGIGEVGAALEAELGRPGLLTYDPANPITALAARVDELLSLGEEERREMGGIAAGLARARWSWRVVAQRLLDLAVR